MREPPFPRDLLSMLLGPQRQCANRRTRQPVEAQRQHHDVKALIHRNLVDVRRELGMYDQSPAVAEVVWIARVSRVVGTRSVSHDIEDTLIEDPVRCLVIESGVLSDE